jgi:hypothetical protein
LSISYFANTEITDTTDDNSESILAQPDPTTINDPDHLRTYYQTDLQASWGKKTVEGIIKSGQILKQAQALLPYGHFSSLAEEFDMDRSVVTRLKKIAATPSLSAHAHKLPPSWYTLYLLTRLKPEKLQAGIETGKVNKAITRADVMKMLPPPKPKKPPSRLNQLRKFMSRHREAMELEFSDNPVLERTIPREMLEIIEAAKQRRRGDGRDDCATQPHPPASPLSPRWS